MPFSQLFSFIYSMNNVALGAFSVAQSTGVTAGGRASLNGSKSTPPDRQ